MQGGPELAVNAFVNGSFQMLEMFLSTMKYVSMSPLSREKITLWNLIVTVLMSLRQFPVSQERHKEKSNLSLRIKDISTSKAN